MSINEKRTKIKDGYKISWAPLTGAFECMHDGVVEKTNAPTMDEAIVLVDSFIIRDKIIAGKAKDKKVKEAEKIKRKELMEDITNRLDMGDHLLRGYFYKAYGDALAESDKVEVLQHDSRPVCLLKDLGINESNYGYAFGKDSVLGWDTYNVVLYPESDGQQNIQSIAGLVMPALTYARLVEVLKDEVSFSYGKKELADRTVDALYVSMVEA